MIKLRAVLIRRWPILATALVLGFVAGYLSAYGTQPGKRPVQYLAEQVIISNRTAGAVGQVEQDSLRLTRGEVLRQAAETLNVTDRPALAKRISVDVNSSKSSLTVTTFDPTASGAAQRVDAFVKAFLDVVNADLREEERLKLDRLKQRVTETSAALDAFDRANPLASTPALLPPNDPSSDQLIQKRTKLEAEVDRARSSFDDATVLYSNKPPYSSLGSEIPRVDEPQLLSVPESPWFRAGLLGGLGLALSVLLVMVLERVNRRIDTREELAEVVNIPIIAEIGHLGAKRQTFHSDGRIRLDGIWAEHYRRIRSAVQFVQVQDRRGAAPDASPADGPASIAASASRSPDAHRVFLITSTLPGEGKSTSTALTALALAEVGVETVVINADFRKPRLDALLGSDGSVTLEDRARFDIDRASIDQVVRPSPTPHLWTAASGPPTYDVGLRIEAARDVAEEASRRGATVLIDSTPIRVANDTIDLLPAADEVLLVVRTGRSTVESLQDTVELLELHNAPLLGIILIGTRGSRELYAYYDSYYTEVEGARKRRGRRRSKGRYGYGGRPDTAERRGRKGQPAPSGAPAPTEVPVAATATLQDGSAAAGQVNGQAPVVPPPLPPGLVVPPPLPVVPVNGSAGAGLNGHGPTSGTNGQVNGGQVNGQAPVVPPPYVPPAPSSN